MDKAKVIKKIPIAIVVLLLLFFAFYIIFTSDNIMEGPTPFKSDKPKEPKNTPKPAILDSFDETIAQFDTSEKLVAFLNEHFEFTDRQGNVALTPEEFFEAQEGGEQDFAVFTSYVLWKHKYEAGIIRYRIEDFTNTVVVFRDEDLPKTIIFTPQGTDIYHHGWSFEEMFQKEEERLGAKINEYTISYWTDEGELWPEEWKKR
jgi:hypothetical protein